MLLQRIDIVSRCAYNYSKEVIYNEISQQGGK